MRARVRELVHVLVDECVGKRCSRFTRKGPGNISARIPNLRRSVCLGRPSDVVVDLTVNTFGSWGMLLQVGRQRVASRPKLRV